MKILFITGGTHTRDNRNLNHHQRVHFLSRQAELTILARKGADFSVSAKAGTPVVRSPMGGKAGQVLYGLWWALLHGRRQRYDLVVTEPSKLCLVGAIIKMVTGARWVVDVWDIPLRRRPGGVLAKWGNRLERSILAVLFRGADLFLLSIVPDHEFRVFGIPSRKLKLFSNAIWLDELLGAGTVTPGLEGGPFRILSMRSVYSPDSGLDLLAEAFAAFRAGGRDAVLTIVGRIPPDVSSQVQGLRVRDDVIFHDFVTHDELTVMIRESSVCVVTFRDSPDLRQTYPVKVLEYLALGAVLLVPSLDGITRIVRDGYNGLVFKADDSKDLLSGLIRLHGDPELGKRLSVNGRVLDSSHDCRVKAQEVLRALTELVGSGRAAAEPETTGPGEPMTGDRT
ncbi:hypothetical protein RW64_20775 [Geobacter sulfurreducens]|nr:hypothetical protein RW64_20775 [Geobacter sulfurreducens]